MEQVKSQVKFINRPSRNLDDTSPYKTYDFDQLEEVPKFLATGLGSEHRVVATASTHDKSGRLVKKSKEAYQVIEHLAAKIQDNLDDYNSFRLNLDDGADTAIISFLASDLSAREAVVKLRAEKKKINHLSLFTIFPISVKAIEEATVGCSRVIIPEVNLQGQYADYLAPYLAGKEIIKVNSLADLISPNQIMEAYHG